MRRFGSRRRRQREAHTSSNFAPTSLTRSFHSSTTDEPGFPKLSSTGRASCRSVTRHVGWWSNVQIGRSAEQVATEAAGADRPDPHLPVGMGSSGQTRLQTTNPRASALQFASFRMRRCKARAGSVANRSLETAARVVSVCDRAVFQRLKPRRQHVRSRPPLLLPRHFDQSPHRFRGSELAQIPSGWPSRGS